MGVAQTLLLGLGDSRVSVSVCARMCFVWPRAVEATPQFLRSRMDAASMKLGKNAATFCAVWQICQSGVVLVCRYECVFEFAFVFGGKENQKNDVLEHSVFILLYASTSGNTHLLLCLVIGSCL